MAREGARVVILGGGTAGWLAAFILGDAQRRAGIAPDVTVVESSSIPTIGVGEGTTALFKTFLDYFKLDEREFLRETEGTIKYGIRHRDWRRTGHTYDGPIDDPHALAPALGPPGFEYLNVYAVAAGRSVADVHLLGQLMQGDKSPYAERDGGGLIAVGRYQYAYHIDNARVGAYLRSRSRDVKLVDGICAGAALNAETGLIEALQLKDARTVAGDLFVDCSGFRRLLIGRELDGGWTSYAKELPVNRAMPFFLPHSEDGEIGPYTVAWARENGWIWQIPTQARMGCGYVYCDAFASPDEARAEVEAALGHPIEPRADIRFETGRVERPWTANCIAVGLAAGFLEPLEATSIHATLVQLMLFAEDFFTVPLRFTDAARADFNARIGRQFDEFRTFLNVHYCGEREDTPFWRHVKSECRHETSLSRLAQWREHMPRADDFAPFLSGLPHVEAQLYYPVLDGLGLLDRALARREMATHGGLKRKAMNVYTAAEREHRRVAALALGHRDYLRRTRTTGRRNKEPHGREGSLPGRQ